MVVLKVPVVFLIDIMPIPFDSPCTSRKSDLQDEFEWSSNFKNLGFAAMAPQRKLLERIGANL